MLTEPLHCETVSDSIARDEASRFVNTVKLEQVELAADRDHHQRSWDIGAVRFGTTYRESSVTSSSVTPGCHPRARSREAYSESINGTT